MLLQEHGNENENPVLTNDKPIHDEPQLWLTLKLSLNTNSTHVYSLLHTS